MTLAVAEAGNNTLAATPGAWEHQLTRHIAGGWIVYHSAPAGWLAKNGRPRRRDYREYLWCPDGGDEIRLPSVSYILDLVCPKPAIAHWAEARGIEGTMIALKTGMIHQESRVEDAVAIIREQGLGAEAAKRRAADRGLNVHAINEHYMLTGEAPKLSEYPAEHHGYIRAWVKCILALKPEPVAVEQLVVHPEDGYAGRLDLRCIVNNRLETWDFKTQTNTGIFRQAHFQVGLYERAAVRCGDQPAEERRVIVLGPDGEPSQMPVDHQDWQLDAALAWWRASKPVDSACQAHNRQQVRLAHERRSEGI